ncbi:uncharacterized protein LOC119167908 isoform X2 [Rhipicephalus microplus]
MCRTTHANGKSCSTAMRLTSAPPEDNHPTSRVHVAKRWNSAGAPCCHDWDEPWVRLFPRAECDRHLETSVMQLALTMKGTRHKAAFVSSYSGWLRISSVMQPRNRGVDTGERTIRKDRESGALYSAAHNFGVFTRKTATHLQDALPCVFAKTESINNTEDMDIPAVLFRCTTREPRRNPACTMAAHVQNTACGRHVVQHCSEADLYTGGGTAADQSQNVY